MKKPGMTIAALAGLGVLSPAALGQMSDSGVETLESDRSTGDRRPVRGPFTVIRPAALFIGTLDTDHDYRITRAEFDSGVARAFTMADRDENGQLSLFELEDWRLAALGSMDALPGNFAFDGNHDGGITGDEFAAALNFEFDRNDGDANGVVLFRDLVRVMEVQPCEKDG